MLNVLGTLIAFIVVIFLIRIKVNFGSSLILGAVIIGLFSLQEIELITIPKAILAASIYSIDSDIFIFDTIELALLLFFIYMLARTMQESGAIDRLIASLKTFFSKTAIIGVVPAIYGLMPVPGGALFSAPMVDKEGDMVGLNRNQKNFVNIWFRHIWFTIYPVSSAMILLSSKQMFDINIYDLVLTQFPIFLVMIVTGAILLYRFADHDDHEVKTKFRDVYGLIYLFAPILPLITSAALMPFGISQIRSFLIGVILSVFLVLIVAKIPSKNWITIIKKGISWKLPIAIFGIMIFREMFAVSKVDVVLGQWVHAVLIPPIILFALIPMFFGIIMGYNLGAIGISFPILAAFIPLFNNGNMVALASVLYISSMVGYLISPLHLCNVVSSEYLKTDTTGMYRIIIPAALTLLLINTVLMVFFV
jgi:integral membrane protein (TIGR00529 family)